jgi:hypothetical protein
MSGSGAVSDLPVTHPKWKEMAQAEPCGERIIKFKAATP